MRTRERSRELDTDGHRNAATPTATATPTGARCENLPITPPVRAELEAVTTTLRKGSVFYGRCDEEEWAEGVTQAVLPDGQEFGGEYFMFSRRSSDQPWQSASAGSDNPTSVRCRLPEELLREWHGEQVAENCAQLKNDSGR